MTDAPDHGRENPAPHHDAAESGDTKQGTAVHTEHLRDYRQLRRSVTDRKIAGVAGGLGRHLNIDPTIIRVLFVVLCFFGGAGLLLYGAAWLLVPREDGQPAAVRTSDTTRNALLIGAAIFAGLLVVGDSWGGFGFPWGLAFLALIVFAILMSRDSNRGQWSGLSVRGPDPQSTYPGATGSGESGATPVGPPYRYTGAESGWQPVIPQPPLPPPKRGPVLFGITLALVAAGLGILGLYEASGNTVLDAAYPALALAIIGVMLVVGAFYGRPGGLVLLGLIAAFALMAASVLGPRFDGDRDVHAVPSSASEVESSYHVPAGEITLDLSRVQDLDALDGRTLHVSANAGEIVVILPRDLGADVDASVRLAGAIDLPGVTKGGFGQGARTHVGDADPDTPQLDLELDVKLGHIEVRQ